MADGNFAPAVTVCVENLMAARAELEPVIPKHWEEIAIFRDKVPLDPDWDSFAALEEQGKVLFVALRQAGELVGYFVGLITPSLHYKTTLSGKMDLIYILPELRSTGGGKLLMDAVLAEGARRGVKMWWMGSKCHKPIEAFFRSYGFTHEESYFALWTGG